MTLDELNRRLLWSHCLSHRMMGSNSTITVADACCGIQSQNFPESLSSFWARIEGFRDYDAISQLRPGGGLVRTRAVRSTMHIIPSKDYYTYVLGGAGERMLNWLDTTQNSEIIHLRKSEESVSTIQFSRKSRDEHSLKRRLER